MISNNIKLTLHKHCWALLIIFLFSSILFVHGSLNNFIPCEKDCGETFIALHQARNSYLTGAKYLWLENLATSPDIQNHPFLYSHNVNIGNLIFTICEKIGLTILWQKQLITLSITALGLLYVYLCIFKVSKDRFLSLLTLFLFSISYNQVFSFGLNALRAWHWLALFGSLYYTQHLLEDFRVKNCLFVLLFAFISFGCGYDFWMIVFLSCLFLSIVLSFKESKNNIKNLLFLGFSFSIPFFLRQFQVLLVLGYDYWLTDFHYTFLSKIPFVTHFFSYPSAEKISEFYQSYNILRPYSLPEKSLLSIWVTFCWMFRDIVYSSYGLINCITVIFSIIFCTINLIRRNPETNYRMPVLYLSIVFGTIVGLFIFCPFSLHVYMKHEFPLLGATFYIAISSIVFFARQYIQNKKLNHILAAFFIFTILAVQIENIKNRCPLDNSWVNFVKAHNKNTYAVSWLNSAVASFTENWVLPLIPGTETQVATNLKNGLLPFDKKMTLCFGERDKEQSWNEYSKPDFWVFFDTTKLTQLRNEKKDRNIEELVRSVPQFTVVEQTKNYVIFDLRPFWKPYRPHH